MNKTRITLLLLLTVSVLTGILKAVVLDWD